MSAEPEYWTAGDVAAFFNASDKTIYRIAKNDPTFPMVKIGGLVRFPRERVIAWFRQREQGSRRLHVVKNDEGKSA
jgi:predicted DNA-binding transcriptional regulator AlpA